MGITSPSRVWSADITYIPVAKGFLYLVAMMDWYSQCVVACGFPMPWTLTPVPRH